MAGKTSEAGQQGEQNVQFSMFPPKADPLLAGKPYFVFFACRAVARRRRVPFCGKIPLCLTSSYLLNTSPRNTGLAR